MKTKIGSFFLGIAVVGCCAAFWSRDPGPCIAMGLVTLSVIVGDYLSDSE